MLLHLSAIALPVSRPTANKAGGRPQCNQPGGLAEQRPTLANVVNVNCLCDVKHFVLTVPFRPVISRK